MSDLTVEKLILEEAASRKVSARLDDGSRLRPRAERPDHLWSYDFVEHRTHKGGPYRMLNVIDALSDLFSLRGMSDHIRSDNGPEFIAKAV